MCLREVYLATVSPKKPHDIFERLRCIDKGIQYGPRLGIPFNQPKHTYQVPTKNPFGMPEKDSITIDGTTALQGVHKIPEMISLELRVPGRQEQMPAIAERFVQRYERRSRSGLASER